MKESQSYSDNDLRDIYRQGEETTVAFMRALLQRLEALERQVASLTRQKAKTSRTSGKPPSSDGLARQRSLRESSGKPPGGQTGHPGSTLALSETPDRVVIHRVAENPETPLSCSCGAALVLPSLIERESAERRQVFDLPEPRLDVVEHRLEICSCPSCGKDYRGAFPPEASARAQFGERFTALAALLNVRHCLPVLRSAELLGDLSGHQVGAATLWAMVKRCGEAVEPAEKAVAAALADAELIHADETGIQCKTKLHWVHTLSTPSLTLLTPSAHRGSEGVLANGVLPAYNGVLVHDCWKPYFQLSCRHALCNAHLLRELLLFANEGQQWAAHIADFLRTTWKTVKKRRAEKRPPTPQETLALEERYGALVREGLRQPWLPWQPAGRTLRTEAAARTPSRKRRAQSPPPSLALERGSLTLLA